MAATTESPGPAMVMDAAQYVIEPPDLWLDRVPGRYRDAAPRVVETPGGGEGWSYEGGAWVRPLGLEVAAGHSPMDIRDRGYRYAEIHRGMHDAKERLADMALDGVDRASLFPTFGMSVRNILEPGLHVACVRAYNDGVWEWARDGAAERLVPQALTPAVGLEAATAELERVAKIGYRGIVFSGWPNGGGEPQPEDDSFWARCEEAGIVINLVRGGPVSADRTPAAPREWIGAGAAHVRPTDAPLEAVWTEAAGINNINLSYLVLTGILDRFPRLQVALIDAGAGWLPVCGELLDWNFRYARFIEFAKLAHMPSDYIRRQVKATVVGERSTIEARHDVGVGALMWASNYPNSSSTWPTSRRSIEAQFRDVPEAERRRMLGENCADLYGVRRQ